MKKLILVTVLLTSASLTQAQLLVDFNSGSELTDNFAGLDSNPSKKHTQAGTGGLGNSGSVTLTSTSQLAVYQTGFDASTLSGDTFGIYYKFQDDGDNNGYPGAIGLTSAASDTYGSKSGSTGTDLRLIIVGANNSSTDEFRIQILNNGASFTGSSSTSLALTSGNWYYLQMTIGGVSGGNFTNVTGELFNSAADGTVGSSLLVLDNEGAGLTITSGLTADNDVYAFFGNQSPANGGFHTVDNFSVSAIIPEPGTYALLVGGVGFLAVSMRRRIRIR